MKLLHVIVLIVITVLFAACAKKESTEELIQQAESAITSNKKNEAVIVLKNVLKSESDNASARWLLAKAYFGLRRPEDSEKELLVAQRLGVGDELILPMLAKSWVMMGNFEKVQALEIENLDDITQGEIMAVKGLAYAAAGNKEDARPLIVKAMEKAPDSPYVMGVNIRFLLTDGKYTQAKHNLKQLLAIDGENEETWDLAGDLARAENEHDTARKAYSKAIELAETKFSYRLKRALHAIHTEDFASARRDAEILAKQTEKHPGLAYVLGRLLFQEEDLQQAKTEFELATRAGEANPMAFYYLALVNYELKNSHQAGDNITKFLNYLPGNHQGLIVAANIEIQRKNYSRAEQIIRPITEKSPEDISALRVLVSSLLAQNKNEEAINILSHITNLTIESEIETTKLGGPLVSSSKNNLGDKRLKSDGKMGAENHYPQVMEILNFIQLKQWQNALTATEKYQSEFPEKPGPYNLIGQIYLSMSDKAKAIASFTKAEQINPGNPEALLMLASLQIANKKLVKARELYNRILEFDENNLAALVALASLEGRVGNNGALITYLNQAIDGHPGELIPRFKLAQHYLLSGKFDAALSLLNALTPAYKDLSSVRNLYASLYFAKQDYSRAKPLTLQLIIENPQTAQYRFQMAMIYAGLGESDKVKDHLVKAVELRPGHVPSRIALARLLLLQKDFKDFDHQLAKLTQVSPESPDVLHLQAARANIKGEYQLSLESLEGAFKKSPNSSTLLNLVSQKQKMADITGAKELLEEWLAVHTDDVIARRALASLHLTLNKPDKAILEYKKIIGIAPNDHRALNNVAWLLRTSNTDQAAKYASRAHQLKPDSASILDTMALIQLEKKQLSEALINIRRAQELEPKSLTIRYHHSLILARSGKKEDAKSILKSVFKTNDALGQSFPEYEDAKKLMDSLSY
ncbi:MAG: PEP-CTERM system TPR-repeat protein PrsT [Pseudomonadales bacterium]|nr:PEP-CTERM system TPR-repeat protein PrsT [Pseudomonadales bacterium]